MPPKTIAGRGEYVSVLLPYRLLDLINAEAAAQQIGVACLIREVLIERVEDPGLKERIRQDVPRKNRVRPGYGVAAKGIQEAKEAEEALSPRKPVREASKTAAGPQDDAALIEAFRDRVLDLESRGYLASSIASMVRVPYRIVEAVLARKATPKKKAYTS